MSTRLALYFGCRDEAGHYLHRGRERLYGIPADLDLPWNLGHMDGGLLRNGPRRDVYDGRVFWTCGGRPTLWFALFWWDRSVDQRPGSNSGFYVRGLGIGEHRAAFNYACSTYPWVTSRQRQQLTLQE